MAQNSTVYSNQGPGCLVRGLWFIFIGLWLGFLWTSAAWLMIISVVFMPIGLLMINRLPQIMTLRPVRTVTSVVEQNGRMVLTSTGIPQNPFLLRALYFILIGWWFSGLWLMLAWALTAITFGMGLPLAFWMFDQVPALTTLSRQ